MKKYELVTWDGEPGIRCNQCGKTSYNRNDVTNRYCGFCHEFLDTEVKSILHIRLLALLIISLSMSGIAAVITKSWLEAVLAFCAPWSIWLALVTWHLTRRPQRK